MDTYFMANDITGQQGKEASNLLSMCGLNMYGIICSTFGDSIEGNCLNLLGTGRENHQELLATLSGGHTFSNLDLSHVYQQVPLTEDSQVHDCVHDQDHPQRPVQVHENTF